MNNLLLIILFGLMVYVGGKRGLKIFLSLCMNFLIIIFTFYLIVLGINPIIITLLSLLLVAMVILYYVSGKNKKTEASFIAVLLVLLLLILLVFIATKNSRIAGFGYESEESINMFSYDVNIDFTNICISLILIGLIGASIDTSISISSALYEIYQNNKKITIKELFRSGMNIGKDIMGTTVNTLFFAFLGEFMTLLIWFKKDNYLFSEIVNNKTFNQEVIKVLFSVLGCILVIPVTAVITAYRLKNGKREINFK